MLSMRLLELDLEANQSPLKDCCEVAAVYYVGIY